MIILRQKEFGKFINASRRSKTGLNAQQAKQFFTKTNTKASRNIRNNAVMNEIPTSNEVNGFKTHFPRIEDARRNMHITGRAGDFGQIDYFRAKQINPASSVDASINAKASLSLGGEKTERLRNEVGVNARNSTRFVDRDDNYMLDHVKQTIKRSRRPISEL